MLFHERYQRFV